MKRFAIFFLLLCMVFSPALAEDEEQKSVWSSIGGWLDQAVEDTSSWATQAWDDASTWVTNAATDTWNWMAGAANDAWNWTVSAANDTAGFTVQTANGIWNGVTGFFAPPSTEGTPAVVAEPEFPEGTLKMYLGYPAVKTGLDNGYHNVLEIGKNDPHFGLSIGKFYVSGFTGVTSADGEHFIFLKTVGDNVELHFELTQDINMLGGDTFVKINPDVGGYDRQFEIAPTDFGRGTLIVRFTDYQNHTGEPQIYTDFLGAKSTGTADTVISLNEEGDYEIALDYEIRQDHYILGTAATNSTYANYRIHFTFSVRNGNCMVFPFDLKTGAELGNTAIAPDGFKLDLAYSRFLAINVKRSVLVEGASGVTEDIRFNRPARDGETYDQEGIYTITVQNEYTGQETTKTLYVGTDEKLIDYVSQGYSLNQILQDMNQ